MNPADVATNRADRSSLRRPTAVALDLDRLGREGYLVPDARHSVLGEELQLAKRALLANCLRKARKSAADRSGLIMVTSALPGEGKTFCAINLAMSLALEVDTSVLLVDADVSRPSLPSRLGVQGGPGLLDLLIDERYDLCDLVLGTNVPKLSLLHTGTLYGHANELLASVSMDRLLNDLASRDARRIVVFDTPPLLMTTSAATLASRVGQVVMVVEASRTSRRDVTQAFSAVAGCPNVFALLNRCELPLETRRCSYY